jgi:hypothetical protein
MAQTVTIDRPSVAEPVSRPRSRKPATVGAPALALHLDCSWTHIGKLEAEGVIRRQGDGLPLDQSGADADGRLWASLNAARGAIFGFIAPAHPAAAP